jgi:regulatory protein
LRRRDLCGRQRLWSGDQSLFLCWLSSRLAVGSEMARVTALRRQKRDDSRINVYLDGAYAFAVHGIMAASLRVGQELSPEDTERLQGQETLEAAYNRSLHFLSFRPRSRAELTAYLERKDETKATVAAVIERLEGAGLIDDEAFARYWVDNRERFRPRGKRALRYELRGKGVASASIDAALQGVDEEASALDAARRRAERLIGSDYGAFHQTMSGYLQRRGFSYDTIKQVVRRLWRESRTMEDPR